MGGVWPSVSGSARTWRLAEHLSRSQLEATWSGCRAGALGQEASHCLGRLLCGCEAFSEVLYCRTKQACGGDRRVGEGDLICILHLRQVREGRQIVAGNPWTSCCFESRIAKILLSSLKEKKSEEPWRMPALYSHITHPIWRVLAGFPAIWYAVQLHCHHWFICVTAQINGHAVTLHYKKKASVSEKKEFPLTSYDAVRCVVSMGNYFRSSLSN